MQNLNMTKICKCVLSAIYLPHGMNIGVVAIVVVLSFMIFEPSVVMAQISYSQNDVVCDSINVVNVDSVADNIKRQPQRTSPYKFKPAQLIVPSVLIGVGAVGLESDWLKFQNKEVRDELQEDTHGRFSIDDYMQYAPMAATYGFNLCGVRGMHGYSDLTIILGTAYALMGITVNTLKYVTKVERPDGSSRNSFPSGHTATAFMGAELLRREYSQVSPWIGVAGYTVAAATGFLRLYNNRHWLTDVIAGAGVGILSTQAAYWLYPLISKALFHKKDVCVAPYVTEQGKGVNCIVMF